MGKNEQSKPTQNLSETRVPLSPAVFYILVALADGDRHGYAIMRDVSRRSGGAVCVGPGTLYGAISRMLRDRLIEESEERPDPEMDDSRRRYYRLTGQGGRVLAAEAKRLEDLARLARSTRIIRKLNTPKEAYGGS